jgi:hypothetical protein
MTYVLVPAYGRRYDNAEALLADWSAGLDFRIFDGPDYIGSYTSKRDFSNEPKTCIIPGYGYGLVVVSPRWVGSNKACR